MKIVVKVEFGNSQSGNYSNKGKVTVLWKPVGQTTAGVKYRNSVLLYSRYRWGAINVWGICQTNWWKILIKVPGFNSLFLHQHVESPWVQFFIPTSTCWAVIHCELLYFGKKIRQDIVQCVLPHFTLQESKKNCWCAQRMLYTATRHFEILRHNIRSKTSQMCIFYGSAPKRILNKSPSSYWWCPRHAFLKDYVFYSIKECWNISDTLSKQSAFVSLNWNRGCYRKTFSHTVFAPFQ